jgi:amidohydrolase
VSKSALLLSTAVLLVTFQTGAAEAQLTTRIALDRILTADYPHLDALYKDIHAHPELGFEERRTAVLLAKQMRAIGFQVTEGVGTTGLVAIYRNGSGPTVLVRTELDALPMEERTGLPYASRVETDWNGKHTFVAHSCGHDIHMAVWVGTAHALVELKNRWHGTLMFVGQPAEEEVSGAKAMLADGLFTRFPKPDYGLALHTVPLAYGTVSYRSGVITSNSDSISITFKGRGGHGAMPDKAIDPVLIAARFIVDVQELISREKDPLKPGVVTVGSIVGGSAGNIIPDEVSLRGTIRDYDDSTRALLMTGVKRIANAEAAMAGAPEPRVILSEERTEAVVNDAGLTERVGRVFTAAFGERAVVETDASPASEDFSEFVRAGVPSLDFHIGIYDSKRMAAAAAGGAPVPANHSPFYAPVPEPTIRTGVEAMTLAVISASDDVSGPRGHTPH